MSEITESLWHSFEIFPFCEDVDRRLGAIGSGRWTRQCAFAVLLAIGSRKKRDLALMDVKEAVTAAAPRYAKQKMPNDQAERVVEGATHLSPHLGKRMVAGKIEGKSVFIRELLPQDLKIELEQLTVPDAMKAASFLAGVVGKAHARQMDVAPQSFPSLSWHGPERTGLPIQRRVRAGSTGANSAAH